MAASRGALKDDDDANDADEGLTRSASIFSCIVSLRRYMDKKLRLRLNGNRDVIGVLRGFDQFLNLVLDDAVNDTTSEKTPMGMIVVRGNSVVSMEALEHIAPAVRRQGA